MADNKEIIKCPACTKEMKKVFISSKKINLDICLDGCGGIYFDNRELGCFDESHENVDEIFEAISSKTFELVDESKDRNCPYCGAKMIKNYSSVDRSVQIDECYTCGGKFLDNGELQKIRDEYSNNEERSKAFSQKLAEIVDEEFREVVKNPKKGINEEGYVKLNTSKTILVPELSSSAKFILKLIFAFAFLGFIAWLFIK